MNGNPGDLMYHITCSSVHSDEPATVGVASQKCHNKKSVVIGLEPINRSKTLGEHAYQRLCLALMSGELVPGQQLTVRSLADHLQVSITPAREALNRLIAERALVMRGPKTIVVPELTQEIYDEITELRLMLEGKGAELAATKITARDIKSLETRQKKISAALDKEDYREVLAQNELFHFTIHRASGLPTLVGFIESLWLRIGPSLNLLYPEYKLGRRGESNHERAIKALKSGDQVGARKAMQQDIRDGYKTLSKALKNAVIAESR